MMVDLKGYEEGVTLYGWQQSGSVEIELLLPALRDD